MAQLVEDIFNDLVEEKASFSSLDTLAVPVTDAGRSHAQQLVKDMNSKSKVAVWFLITWTFAYLCRKIQVLWDRSFTDLNKLAETAQPGTKAWLVAQALAYRDGYPLTIDSNYRAVYSEEAKADLDAAIVKAASVTDQFGVALLKVAKGAPGSFTSLAVDELGRFRDYMDQVRFAGQSIQSVSRANDSLKLTVNVYFDGLLDQDTIQNAAKQAVRDYLAKDLGFDGIVHTSKVVDAIKAVTGIRDASIQLIQAKKMIGAYGTITRVYTTFSGYIKLDETSTFTMISE
jgi:hypothetical protein